jgi:sterol desaturase/sphingolipid hydroxylase (fatty acid hydroxylase superfamily)
MPIESHPMPVAASRRDRLILLLPAVVVALFVGFWLVDALSSLTGLGDPAAAAVRVLKKFYWGFWSQFLLDPFLMFGLPIAFLLQYLKPVDKQAPALGSSTRTDFLYSLWDVGMLVALIPAQWHFLRLVYDTFFWYLSFDFVLSLPTWGQYLLGHALIDFIGWADHRIHHKVPVFWQFHAIHHSQQHLNPFSTRRRHPFDFFTSSIISFLPVFMFKDALGIALSYLLASHFLESLIHANFKTNFGWLRYILVTPQSHRVHHSARPEHFDSNYGVTLSIWDRIFGTQFADHEIYPETGIPDKAFPFEQSGSLPAVLTTLWRQTLYPFKQIWKVAVGA